MSIAFTLTSIAFFLTNNDVILTLPLGAYLDSYRQFTRLVKPFLHFLPQIFVKFRKTSYLCTTLVIHLVGKRLVLKNLTNDKTLL